MNTVLTVLCTVLCCVSYTVSLIKFTHFFQLNSYRAALQFKWIKSNSAKLFPNIFLGAFALFGAFYTNIAGYIICISASVLAILTSFPKKAKKPLVYTMRVKRLLITAFIILALSLGLGFLLGNITMASAACFILCPFIILLANLINKPLENAIVNYYINDAKKLLSSSNAKVIGITGSYGKTSVKYYLSTLLKAKYNNRIDNY